MKVIMQLMISSILYLAIVPNAIANSNCSSKHLLVCVKLPSSNIQEKCIPNANMENFWINNPESTIGSCDQFDSSKLKTFACNAGLRFLPKAAQQCIRRDQNNLVSSSCEDSQDCFCSSEEGPEINYFNYGIADYKGDPPTSFTKKNLSASQTSNYASASPQSGLHILQDGSSLQFQLGSNFYGAEYYVDLCIQNNNPNALNQDLNLNGSILMNNSIFSKNSYNVASALNNKIDVTCLNSANSAVTSTIADNSLFQTSERRYSGRINGSPLCVVRNYFRETVQNKMRDNSFKKVTFQTNISVSPVNSDNVQNLPVNFCNIQKIQNKYACTQWTSINQEEFIKALKINGLFFSGQTYTGTCPIPCGPL
mgnify:CR=1 FL=1